MSSLIGFKVILLPQLLEQLGLQAHIAVLAKVRLSLCVGVFLHVCLCSMCVPGAQRPERASGIPKRESQTVVSCCVGAGD